MEYTIKLSHPELMAVTSGLGELPLKLSFNAFARIQQQMQEQDAKAPKK